MNYHLMREKISKWVHQPDSTARLNAVMVWIGMNLVIAHQPNMRLHPYILNEEE